MFLGIWRIGRSTSFDTLMEQRGLKVLKRFTINSQDQKAKQIYSCFDPDIPVEFLTENLRGILITSNKIASAFLSKNHRSVKARMIEGDNNLFFSGVFYYGGTLSCLDTDKTSRVHLDNGGEESSDLINVNQLNGLLVISFAFDVLMNHLNEVGWSYQTYYSKHVKKEFVEVGPNVCWSSLGDIIFYALVINAKKVSIPIVCLSYIQPNKKPYCIRIDADGFTEKSTEDVCNLLVSRGIKATWFIDVLGWLPRLRCIKFLKSNNQDIQLHSFRHSTYRKTLPNILNFWVGKMLLAIMGVRVNCCVSPFGYYTFGFQRAIQRLNFHSSSEFGYDTDNFPSFPKNDAKFPLQIPCHPGSIGVFRQSGWNDREIFEHFEKQIFGELHDRGYSLIYDHPVDRLETVIKPFGEMLSKLNVANAKSCSFLELAELLLSRELPSIYINKNNDIEFDGPVAKNFLFFVQDCDQILNMKGLHTKKLLPRKPRFMPVPTSESLERAKRKNKTLSSELNDTGFHWLIRNFLTLGKVLFRSS